MWPILKLKLAWLTKQAMKAIARKCNYHLFLQIITVILFMQELFYVKIASTRTSMSGSFGSTQAKGPRDQSLNHAWSKLL